MASDAPVALLSELKAVPMLAELSATSLQWLGSQVKLRDIPAGQALFMQDAWGSVVYLILAGWAKVRRALRAQDSTKTLALLGPGAWVGEMAVLDEAPRSRDVLALTPLRVAGIPAATFKALMLREPQLCYQLACSLSRRLRLANLQADLDQQSPRCEWCIRWCNWRKLLARRPPGDAHCLPSPRIWPISAKLAGRQPWRY